MTILQADYGSKANGGYRSVVRKNACASTLSDQHMAPTAKAKIPRGYRPVKSIANHATTTPTTTAIQRKATPPSG